MAFVPRASTHPSQIEAAKYLLAEPGFTIAHIARQFNWADQGFYRSFIDKVIRVKAT